MKSFEHNSVLNDFRDQGKVECLGKGRWAKWRRIV